GRCQLRPEPSAFSIHHVACSASSLAVKELLATLCISRSNIRLFFDAADVRYNLPNLFIRHSHANATRSGRRHGRSWNPFVDIVKNFLVGISVPLWRACQIRPTATASRAQSMAKRAVHAKL